MRLFDEVTEDEPEELDEQEPFREPKYVFDFCPRCPYVVDCYYSGYGSPSLISPECGTDLEDDEDAP